MKQRLYANILIILSTVGVLAWAFLWPVPTTLAAPMAQSCGEVDTHGSTPYSPNAYQIEHCFWHASKICTDRTLTFHIMGIDSGSTRQFWISPRCRIHESLDTYVIPLSHHHIANIACDQAEFFNDGLHILGCIGDPSIVIPF
jgi:hypothetical protein